jgi:hypothetical protein
MLLVLVSLATADAAPPAGTPVFIQVQGLAPTTVGLDGFIVAGDFTEGGGSYSMPSSGVTLVGGTSAYISRDGKRLRRASPFSRPLPPSRNRRRVPRCST